MAMVRDLIECERERDGFPGGLILFFFNFAPLSHKSENYAPPATLFVQERPTKCSAPLHLFLLLQARNCVRVSVELLRRHAAVLVTIGRRESEADLVDVLDIKVKAPRSEHELDFVQAKVAVTVHIPFCVACVYPFIKGTELGRVPLHIRTDGAKHCAEHGRDEDDS